MIYHRRVGDIGNGGYLVRRSFKGFIMRPIWNWRFRQAIKIADMARQPDVIKALHKALREHEPMYLETWRETNHKVGDAVDDLYDIMEWLRKDKAYPQADRLRAVIGRLARAVPMDHMARKTAIRNIARTFK